MKLECPKCEQPLVVERSELLKRDDQLAGSRCAACGVVLLDKDISEAIKKALGVLLGRQLSEQ
ncbi:hypothetical protein [Pseudomonas sp. Sample_16]|uniref:hypothetical protein n=1 Tax=Pseudomonas sp. Sample_16 TaxID=2448263 RepID=UPI001032FA8C|nr:hypothetical protein [Pseudomonas sp. Sample_16]